MKESKKIYLIAILQLFSPFIWMGIFLIYSLIYGPIFQSRVGVVLSYPLTYLTIVNILETSKNFSKAARYRKYEEYDKDGEMGKFYRDAKLAKKKFRALLKKVRGMGVFKEIYRTDYYSILNFSDIFYLFCPYHSILDNDPYGIASTGDEIIDIINTPEDKFPEIEDERFEKTVSLGEDTFEKHIKASKDYTGERPSRYITPELDKLFYKNRIYDKFGIVGACVSYIGMICFEFADETLGFIVSLISLALGIISTKHESRTTKSNAFALICSAIVIFSFVVAFLGQI